MTAIVWMLRREKTPANGDLRLSEKLIWNWCKSHGEEEDLQLPEKLIWNWDESCGEEEEIAHVMLTAWQKVIGKKVRAREINPMGFNLFKIKQWRPLTL
ncbi:hypothetical protein IC582_011832 [Cucumis melo]